METIITSSLAEECAAVFSLMPRVWLQCEAAGGVAWIAGGRADLQ